MKRKLRLIIIAFSASFLVMAALSFYSMKQFETLILFSDQIDRTYQVINRLHILESTAKELEIKARGYIITRDSIYIHELQENIKKIDPAIISLKEIVAKDKKQSENVTNLRAAFRLRLQNIDEHLASLKNDSGHLSMALFEKGKHLKIECIRLIDKMKEEEEGHLRTRSLNQEFYQRLASNTIRYLLFIFCLVTAALFLVMISELKKRLASQEELQNKIIDVKRSHSELEQIAYASSHDLQEPLRKIQVFTDRFAWLRRHEMDEETSETIKRINAAAMRMQELIEDLANLTTLTKDKELKEPTDLNRILSSVLSDLSPRIGQKDATIYKEVLPEIKGHPNQLHVLFKSLLDNSLKFSREDVKPLISIRSDKVSGDELLEINDKLAEKHFFRITIADNGIGFDNKFISKMFQIFQRLHNQQSGYEGKGVGLAICQRVMANHEGYIIAHGHPEVGATFKLFFPATAAS
jgi:signal transduction histidine kinase